MDKDTVIDYVMNTPHNPNKAVLSGMLDSFAGSSGTVSVPVPTVEDAGKSIVVNDEGQYELASASGGGTEPLIISDTEETVQDPASHTYYLTDTLATDAYEAWQSGRPIYRSVNGDMWAVSRVTSDHVITLYWDSDNDGIAQEAIAATPFSDGYLCVPEGGPN